MLNLLDAIANRFLFFALHLNNTGSFPPPLSSDEERECLLAYAAGDNTARDTLIERNLRLVVHVIKKYYANCTDQDDLISVGTIGLIKAIHTFDVAKGARLATYAARCIDKTTTALWLFSGQKRGNRVPLQANGRCSSKSAPAWRFTPGRLNGVYNIGRCLSIHFNFIAS
jgi:RNA polymerase sporulation-specific sigma factor